MNRQFPALRGWAISLVVLHHSIEMSMLYPLDLGYSRIEGLGRWVLLALRELGVFAVPTFLFISGNFIAWAARGDPPKFTWKAVWAALNRILWPYVFWSLVFYGVVSVVRGESSSLPGMLKKLLIGYPYHFVPLIVFYYLVSPILVRLARRWSLVCLMAIALVQLALLNLVSPGILGFEFPGWVRTIVPNTYNSVFANWGIYLPLGMVCTLNAKAVVSRVKKLRWPLLAATAVLFVIHVLSAASALHFPLAGQICPILFVLLSLLVRRNSIPGVHVLERVGKGSYGVYLIHLSALWITVIAIRATIPWLIGHPILLVPILFLSSLGIPLAIMGAAARLPTRRAYRYVFG